MEVAIWDAESLIVHLIENDLRNERLRHDFSTAKHYNLKRSSLIEPVLELLGIFEPMLKLEFSKFYAMTRKQVHHIIFSHRCVQSLAMEIFHELVDRSQKNSVVLRQNQYQRMHPIQFDSETIIISLIKNDIIQQRNLDQLKGRKSLKDYVFSIWRPAFWLMKIWDARMQNQYRSVYFSLINEQNQTADIGKPRKIEAMAEDIYNEILSLLRDLTA